MEAPEEGPESQLSNGEHWLLFWGSRVQLPGPMCQLKSVYNSSSKESEIQFRPP